MARLDLRNTAPVLDPTGFSPAILSCDKGVIVTYDSAIEQFAIDANTRFSELR